MILAGLPPTTALSGTSLVTTEPAATTALRPMVTQRRHYRLMHTETIPPAVPCNRGRWVFLPIFWGIVHDYVSSLPLRCAYEGRSCVLFPWHLWCQTYYYPCYSLTCPCGISVSATPIHQQLFQQSDSFCLILFILEFSTANIQISEKKTKTFIEFYFILDVSHLFPVASNRFQICFIFWIFCA